MNSLVQLSNVIPRCFVEPLSAWVIHLAFSVQYLYIANDVDVADVLVTFEIQK